MRYINLLFYIWSFCYLYCYYHLLNAYLYCYYLLDVFYIVPASGETIIFHANLNKWEMILPKTIKLKDREFLESWKFQRVYIYLSKIRDQERGSSKKASSPWLQERHIYIYIYVYIYLFIYNIIDASIISGSEHQGGDHIPAKSTLESVITSLYVHQYSIISFIVH